MKVHLSHRKARGKSAKSEMVEEGAKPLIEMVHPDHKKRHADLESADKPAKEVETAQR